MNFETSLISCDIVKEGVNVVHKTLNKQVVSLISVTAFHSTPTIESDMHTGQTGIMIICFERRHNREIKRSAECYKFAGFFTPFCHLHLQCCCCFVFLTDLTLVWNSHMSRNI